MFSRIIFVILLTITSCTSKNSCCSCLAYNEVVIDQIEQKDLKAYLTQRDVGVYGEVGTLKICNTKDSLKEEINLRVEDDYPKIDSIVGRDVYIRYTYPRNPKSTEIENLEFKSIVVGEALVNALKNKNKLKYSYHFYNYE